MRGGGVAFGPKPRDFATGLPKKVYDLAWRTALSYRFRKGELIVVDNAIEIESPSALLLDDIFRHHEKLRGKGRSLLVTLEERPLLEEALAEMDRMEQARTWEEVDVKNLLELSRVIIERDALHNILLSHQEDLTHVSVQPWHKSLVRSSPPDLEGEIGWAEFRDLQLLEPKEQKSARPAAYESVASQRYAYAETLPEGVERDDLMRSAYELIAESKQLQFEETTGASFADYAAAKLDNEQAEFEFPRAAVLKYQWQRKLDRSSESSTVSQLESDELELEAAVLEVELNEVYCNASLLAAQTWEHLDVAQRLKGDIEEAEQSLDAARRERTSLDVFEQELADKKIAVVDAKIKVVETKLKIAKSEEKSIAKARLQKKWEALIAEREAMIAAQAEAQSVQEEASAAEFAEGEELVDQAEEIEDPNDPRYVPLSPPIQEEMRRMRRAKMLKEKAAAEAAAAKKSA